MLPQGGKPHPANGIRGQVNRLAVHLKRQLATQTGDLAAYQHVGTADGIQTSKLLQETLILSTPITHPGAQIIQALGDIQAQVQSQDFQSRAWRLHVVHQSTSSNVSSRCSRGSRACVTIPAMAASVSCT